MLVRDQAAFESRYGALANIAGEYGDAKLSNGGEQVLIRAADGETIKDFTYSDRAPWPESADGGGFSLTLILPESNPLHGEASSWRASGFTNGSPASSDATRFSGDPLGDDNRNGISNLVEYAVGDTLELGLAGAGSLTFRLNVLADDVVVSVEVSRDLATWESGPEAAVLSSRIDHGDGTATVVWQSQLSGSQRHFMRVRATTR